MAREKNTMQLIEKSMRKIDKKYEMKFETIADIICNSRNQFDLINNGFCFGYMQGIKAYKAKMKKRGTK